MYCSTRSTVPSTWIPSANPPISITSLSQLVCPKFVKCLAKPHSIALIICAFIPFSWTPTIIVRSCDLILILFLFNHIASLSRPRLFRISATFDREFIGHHRVSSSPALQPIIVNSSSAQLASPSLPAQYCPIIARTHHRPDYSAHQTNSTLSTYSFFDHSSSVSSSISLLASLFSMLYKMDLLLLRRSLSALNSTNGLTQRHDMNSCLQSTWFAP